MTARMLILALAAVLALGGLGTALAVGDDEPAPQPIEMRKDDAGSDLIVEEEDESPEPDDDLTADTRDNSTADTRGDDSADTRDDDSADTRDGDTTA